MACLFEAKTLKVKLLVVLYDLYSSSLKEFLDYTQVSYLENKSLGKINFLYARITGEDILFHSVNFIMHVGFVLKNIYAKSYFKANGDN